MRTSNKQGKKPVYEPEFRIAVAREYLTGNLGYGRLAVKYELPGPTTVVSFVKWYQRHYQDESIIQTNQSCLAEPDKALAAARLKITGLEMFIQKAGKELGVDLVKKYGTKQLKK